MEQTDAVPPSLKGFLVNMIKETMYGAGYSTEQVLQHLAETQPRIDSLSREEVNLALLDSLKEGAFVYS